MSLTEEGVCIGLSKAVHQNAIIADFDAEFCRVRTEVFK
jgi:hypothetical protein